MIVEFFFFFCGEGDKCILYLRRGPIDLLSKFFFSRKLHLIETRGLENKKEIYSPEVNTTITSKVEISVFIVTVNDSAIRGRKFVTICQKLLIICGVNIAIGRHLAENGIAFFRALMVLFIIQCVLLSRYSF